MMPRLRGRRALRPAPSPAEPPSQPSPRPPTAHDAGQTTAFFVVLMAGLFLFAGLVLDGGLALAGKVAAADVAQEAARAGTQQLDLAALRATHRARLDPQRAVKAALAYVRAAGDTGQAHADGESVQVLVKHRQPTQILSMVGISELTTTGRATARAEQGTSTPWNGAKP